ncbi:MAG: restriction endonuclease subunit S [Clostridiales bacterium]|nr:restriction endonuclease subunit S [Clostridiales bacterium]
MNEHEIFGISARKYITEEGLKNSAAKLVSSNSIAIVTRVGVGKLAVITFDYATSQDFLSLSELNIDIQFGAYSIYKRLQKDLHQVQGTSIKGITKEELLNKIISVPIDTAEQIAIGEFFRTLDKLIELHS